MEHQLSLRVYIEDTDAGGIVYHANYLKYAERARTEFLRDHGFNKNDILEKFGCQFVVTKCTANYKHPARLDDKIDVFSTISIDKRATLDFVQQMYKNEVVLAKICVTVACVDLNGKVCRIPPELMTALK